MYTPSTSTPSKRVRPARPAPTRTRTRRVWDPIGSLKIWQKLLLISVAFVVPLAFLMGILIVEQNEEVNFAAREERGLTLITPLTEALFNLPRAAGLSSVYLSGTTWVEFDLNEALEVVDQAVADLDVAAGTVDEFRLTQEVAALRTAWRTLKVDGLTLSAADNRIAWDNLIESHFTPLILEVANRSGLVLDPDLDTYYVMDVVVNKLPELAHELGDVLTRSSAIALSFSEGQRTELATDVDTVSSLIRQIERSLGFAASVTPKLIQPLQGEAERAAGEADSLILGVEYGVLQPEAPSVDILNLLGRGTDLADALQTLTTQSTDALFERLQARVQRLQRNQLVSLSLVAFALVFTFALVAGVSRRISGPVNKLFSASKRLSDGDLTARAAVSSNDELGALAQTFNASVEQLRLKAASDAEAQARNDQLQRNIGEFLNVAMDISDGDFTKRGTVTDDVLGSVIDAINLMVEEVAGLLTDVQDAALSVNEGSGEMLSSTGAIAQTAQRTAGEAQRIRG